MLPHSYLHSNISTDQMLYTEDDIEKSMDKIETLNFHQEMDVNGVKFWCYHAGEAFLENRIHNIKS